jgi:hypothetical protein
MPVLGLRAHEKGAPMQDQDRPGWYPPITGDSPVPQHSAPAQHSADEQHAADATAAPRRSRVGIGVAVAAISIGALGVAGTAYAASSSPSPSPTSTGNAYGPGPGARQGLPGQGGPGDAVGDRRGVPGGGMMGGPHGRPGPGMGLGMGMRGAIHGTFVTPKQGGGYQTVDTQQGTVTAVSTTSITVTSSDGFTKTYLVTADTIVNATRDGIESVKNGDEVGVMAIGSGSDADAVTIMDRTRIDSSRQKWAPPAPPGSATPSAAPSSTA